MRTFSEIWEIALARKGAEVLEDRIAAATPVDDGDLAATTDDRWLSMMARRVFAAGFVWRVIEAKWDGFEEAFRGFDPITVAHLSDEEIDALAQDARIVRNRQKILATVQNAQFVIDTSDEHGGFGQWVADWPADDPVGLWDALHKGGSRLGGQTAALLLRYMGRDTFFLSPDVIARLMAEGVIHKAPTSKRDKLASQVALVQWAQESGRPLAEASMIAACSIDAPRS